MIAPTLRLLTQVTRNLAQTAMTQEVKNPYLFAALTPFVETFIEGIMTSWDQVPQQPQLPTQTPSEQCLPTDGKVFNEEQVLKLLREYDQYQAQSH